MKLTKSKAKEEINSDENQVAKLNKTNSSFEGVVRSAANGNKTSTIGANGGKNSSAKATSQFQEKCKELSWEYQEMFSQVKLEPFKETAQMTDEEIKNETFKSQS